jgi:hypothetical protein
MLCYYADYCYAESRNAGCRYAECPGAFGEALELSLMFTRKARNLPKRKVPQMYFTRIAYSFIRKDYTRL